MKITLGRGFDSIIFGLNKNEVIERLGSPDKIYDLDSGDVCYEYYNWQISLNLDPDVEDTVSWMNIKNRDAKLQEQYIWNKSKDEIIELFENLLGAKHELDDYGSMESVGFEDHGLELQFELGRLNSINIGYLFDEEDSPIWPEQ